MHKVMQPKSMWMIQDKAPYHPRNYPALLACDGAPVGFGPSAIAAARDRCGVCQFRRQGQGDSAHGQPRRQGQEDSVHGQPRRQGQGDSVHGQPRQRVPGDSVLFFYVP